MKKLLFLACVAFVLTGCNTMQGLGKDVQKAGAVVEGAAKNNGEYYGKIYRIGWFGRTDRSEERRVGKECRL